MGTCTHKIFLPLLNYGISPSQLQSPNMQHSIWSYVLWVLVKQSTCHIALFIKLNKWLPICIAPNLPNRPHTWYRWWYLLSFKIPLQKTIKNVLQSILLQYGTAQQQYHSPLLFTKCVAFKSIKQLLVTFVNSGASVLDARW